MNWKPELEELARREALAAQMGGEDKVQRQHDAGRLTVRDRIHRLLDPGSLHEVGALSGSGDYDAQAALQNVTPANGVFGRGRIAGLARFSGHPVLPLASDPFHHGGAWGADCRV